MIMVCAAQWCNTNIEQAVFLLTLWGDVPQEMWDPCTSKRQRSLEPRTSKCEDQG